LNDGASLETIGGCPAAIAWQHRNLSAKLGRANHRFGEISERAQPRDRRATASGPPEAVYLGTGFGARLRI
jgi:hypothetical protein